MNQEKFDLHLEQLIEGALDESEKETFLEALHRHEWAQNRFVTRMTLGADLRRGFLTAEASIPQSGFEQEKSRPSHFRPALLAASIVMAIGVFALARSSFISKPIATLASSENAAWEGSLPTAPGSELTSGFLKLKSGVATIRFRSGANVILEAPAHLILESPMRGRLLAGSAVIDVPESAIGFVIGTPDGYAVDHGTQFAVSVDTENQRSTFEVLSGEISVHHPASGQSLRLTGREAAVAKRSGLSEQTRSGEDGTLPDDPAMLRLGTDGQEMTVIRSNDRKGKIHPDFLMAKRSSFVNGYDRHSLFAFDLGKLDLDDNINILSARLRLNLVPCGLGFAARLPEISTFSIYGSVTPLSTEQLDWNSVPLSKKEHLLGSFSISRGQQSGSFGIETKALSQFLNTHRGKSVTFILVRNTDEAEGNGLVHAFASSRHPEASGPILEIR